MNISFATSTLDIWWCQKDVKIRLRAKIWSVVLIELLIKWPPAQTFINRQMKFTLVDWSIITAILSSSLAKQKMLEQNRPYSIIK